MRRQLQSVGSVAPGPRRAFRPLLRPRVSQLLDSAYHYPVTVLIAGAGYGKSVALDHWLAGIAGTVVRYNLRESTHGVFDFTLGLAGALGTHIKTGSKAAAAAVNAAERSSAPEADLALWLDNALRKFTGTIVIDDFHVAAGEDPRTAQLLAKLIERTTGRIHWIIASRVAAGLPITSWIAYGKSQMAIGERDLAFTHDEACAAAADAGAELSAAHLNELYAYTGGWPTALTFALLSSQRTFDLEELRASTRELSYQFLAEQVLLSLSAGDVAFLLDTSVFARLDLELLAAAGYAEPRKRLQFLKDNASFIVADADGSLRYHDLFRDFLRNELAKDDAHYLTAWTNAARAYEKLAEWALALEAYRLAGDVAAALRVLESQGFQLIAHGQRRAVVRSLDALPRDMNLDRYPAILALRANCEANAGNMDRAVLWYRQAVASAPAGQKQAELSLEFARELVQRSDPEAIAVLERALDPALPAALFVSILGTLSTAYSLAGRPDEAAAAIDDALRRAAPIADGPLHAELLHQHAYILLVSGRTREASERAAQALQFAKEHDLHALAARAQSMLYYINSTAENIAEALWWTKQMERSARDAGDMLLLFSALIGAYELEVERANADALPRLNEQLRSFDAARFSRSSSTLLPSFAMQAAWQRRFDESLRILSGTEHEFGSGYRAALRSAEIALYAAAAGHRERAEAAASLCQQQMRSDSAIEPYIVKRHVKALVFAGLSQLLIGKNATANRLISEAEKLCGSVGERTRSLVRASRSMFVHAETRLLDDEVRLALRAMHDSGYGGVARLLEALPIPSGSTETSSAILTRTELDVLRSLVRAGDSKSAAADLGKSSHTIDWHVKTILKKLGVSSRREAIAFARDQGLI